MRATHFLDSDLPLLAPPSIPMPIKCKKTNLFQRLIALNADISFSAWRINRFSAAWSRSRYEDIAVGASAGGTKRNIPTNLGALMTANASNRGAVIG